MSSIKFKRSQRRLVEFFIFCSVRCSCQLLSVWLRCAEHVLSEKSSFRFLKPQKVLNEKSWNEQLHTFPILKLKAEITCTTLHVMDRTISWMFWFLSATFRWSWSVSLIHRLSQRPSQAFSQLQSQGLPCRAKPPVGNS